VKFSFVLLNRLSRRNIVRRRINYQLLVAANSLA
jgi:hypothetical protein